MSIQAVMSSSQRQDMMLRFGGMLLRSGEKGSLLRGMANRQMEVVLETQALETCQRAWVP